MANTCKECGSALPEMSEDEKAARLLAAAYFTMPDGDSARTWDRCVEHERVGWRAVARRAFEMFTPKVTRTVCPPVVIEEDPAQPEAQPAAHFEPSSVQWRKIGVNAVDHERPENPWASTVRAIIASAELAERTRALGIWTDTHEEEMRTMDARAMELAHLRSSYEAHAKEVAELKSVCDAKQKYIDHLSANLEGLERERDERLDRIRKAVG